MNKCDVTKRNNFTSGYMRKRYKIKPHLRHTMPHVALHLVSCFYFIKRTRALSQWLKWKLKGTCAAHMNMMVAGLLDSIFVVSDIFSIWYMALSYATLSRGTALPSGVKPMNVCVWIYTVIAYDKIYQRASTLSVILSFFHNPNSKQVIPSSSPHTHHVFVWVQSIWFAGILINRPFSQMRVPLAACRELTLL